MTRKELANYCIKNNPVFYIETKYQLDEICKLSKSLDIRISKNIDNIKELPCYLEFDISWNMVAKNELDKDADLVTNREFSSYNNSYKIRSLDVWSHKLITDFVKKTNQTLDEVNDEEAINEYKKSLKKDYVEND